MLAPEEFGVCSLSQAVPFSLMIPRTKYEATFLIGGSADEPLAVSLDDQNQYRSFECKGNESWSGLLVLGVSIEVDETSVFDPRQSFAKPGAIVRHEQCLAISSINERAAFRPALVPIRTGLKSVPSEHQAAFLHWKIVLGQGSEKRTLFVIDLREM